jgi:hypothetical protein
VALHLLERVARDAPAALVDDAGEPPGDEVGIGRDVHAVDLEVVARVRDDRDVVVLGETRRELGPAGAAGEDGYHSSSGRPVSLMPACVL